MKVPTKEELERDADIVARYYLALTDKGVKPGEATYMSMIYLAHCKDQGPKEPWQ